MNNQIKLNHPKLTTSGTRFHHYQEEIKRLGELKAKQTESDSGIVFLCFRDASEAEVRQVMEASGFYWHGHHCHCSHDCCACWFAGPVSLHKVGHRVLATQSFGRNI